MIHRVKPDGKTMCGSVRRGLTPTVSVMYRDLCPKCIVATIIRCRELSREVS